MSNKDEKMFSGEHDVNSTNESKPAAQDVNEGEKANTETGYRKPPPSDLGNDDSQKDIIGHRANKNNLVESGDDTDDEGLIDGNPSHRECLHMNRPTDEELEKISEKKARAEATAALEESNSLANQQDEKPRAQARQRARSPMRGLRNNRRPPPEDAESRKLAAFAPSQSPRQPASQPPASGLEPTLLVTTASVERTRDNVARMPTSNDAPSKEAARPPTRTVAPGAVQVRQMTFQGAQNNNNHNNNDDDQGAEEREAEEENQGDKDATSDLENQNLIENLIVAELATNDEELQKENAALKEELKRISESAVSARFVVAACLPDAAEEENENDLVPVEEENEPSSNKQMRNKRCIGIALLIAVLLLVILVAVVVAVSTSGKGKTSTSAAPTTQSNNTGVTNSSVLPVLETIQRNGVLRCRANSGDAKKGSGFTVDLCRALATAVLGNASKVSFVNIPFREQFLALSKGELDISTELNTLNMARDVYHEPTGYGYTFSDPFFYSGTSFAGLPGYVDCVDREESFQGICGGLLVCVIQDTVTKDLVSQYFPGASIQPVANSRERTEAFANGTCNVIAGSKTFIYEQRVRELNYTGDYAFSNRGLWSFEPYAMITRQSDPHWSDFSNWVLRSLITAEHLNLTNETANEFPQTELFGGEFKDMFRRAIAAVGNYGQMYERHFQERIPRQGMNLLNEGNTTGLLVVDPLGDIILQDTMELLGRPMPGPVPEGTLETVKKRGYLRCGLPDQQLGFAHYNNTSGSWSGLDIEFCKAVSAAIFTGNVDSIVYESYDETSPEQFAGLSNKSVDVIAGGTISMASDIGYSCGHPYFFGEDGTRRALVTRQDDPQFSDFVRWVSQASMLADSEGITHNNASQMPIIELFGNDYQQMLRYVILATGNYQEKYARTLEAHIPLPGWNKLNSGNDPQHMPYSFGTG